MSRPEPLAPAVVADWLIDHPAWSLERGHLTRTVRLRNYRDGAHLVGAQVDLAEYLDHHPVVTLGYREVHLELWTHDREGVTSLDLDYAEGFEELVATLFADALA